jgi:hypothetical protein
MRLAASYVRDIATRVGRRAAKCYTDVDLRRGRPPWLLTVDQVLSSL